MFSKFKVKHYLIYSAFILFLCPLSGIAQELTLRLHCWEGYAKPYVKDFKILIKHKYDIDVNMVISNVSDPDEFWQKARGLKVDLISPAHNIPNSKQWPFIESGVALPINLDNIPNYKYVLPFLKYNRFITNVKGDVFGIPYTMGPYGLAYNADKVKEPKSWNVLWQDDAQRRYTVSKDYPDANTYIAALALGAKYKHIYDSDKLWATVGRVPLKTKVEALAANAFSLWEGTANPKEFGLLRYAATWGYAVSEANKKGLNWKMARPKEGTSLWVDHWLITHAVNKPLKKLIAEEWINYTLSKTLQIGVVRNWGVSPVVTNITSDFSNKEVDTFNVGDNEYWKTLSLWQHQSIRTQNTNKFLWRDAIKIRKEKYGKKLAVGVGNFAPFFIEEDGSGLFLDLLREVIKLMPLYELDIRYLPYKRKLKEINSGDLDVAANVFADSKTNAYLSVPFFRFTDVAVTYKNKGYKIESIEDLKDKHVIAYDGATELLGLKFKKMALSNPLYKEYHSTVATTGMLVNKRVDVKVGDIYVFLYDISRPEYKNKVLPSDFTIHPLWEDMFTHIAFKDKKIRDEANKAIMAIKENGTYDAVYKKYELLFRATNK